MGGVLQQIDNFYLDDERYYNTPSRKLGVDAETEKRLRAYGCDRIQRAVVLLGKPQVVAATAQILLHRFYFQKDVKSWHIRKVSVAVTWIAAKIEEQHDDIRLRDLVLVFDLLQQRENLAPGKKAILENPDSERFKEVLAEIATHYEMEVFKALGFVCHVNPPHKLLQTLLGVFFDVANDTSGLPEGLLQEAWNLANDSLRIPICVRYRTLTIACACIFLAARRVGFPMPEDPPWWDVLGTPLADMETIAVDIQSLYALPKPEYISINKGETAASMDARQAEQSASAKRELGERSEGKRAALDSDSSRPHSATDAAAGADADIAVLGRKWRGSEHVEASVHTQVASERDPNGAAQRQDAGDGGGRRLDQGGAKVPFEQERDRDRERERSGGKESDRRDRERERRRDGKHRERDRFRESEGLRERERSRHREREGERDRHKGRKGGGDIGASRRREGSEQERGSGFAKNAERLATGGPKDKGGLHGEPDAPGGTGASRPGSPAERQNRKAVAAGSGNYLVDDSMPVPGPPLRAPQKSPAGSRLAANEKSPPLPGPPARSRGPIELASSSPSPSTSQPRRARAAYGPTNVVIASDEEDGAVQALPGPPRSPPSRPPSRRPPKRASSSVSPPDMPPQTRCRLGVYTPPKPPPPGRDGSHRGGAGPGLVQQHIQRSPHQRAKGPPGEAGGFIQKLDGSGPRRVPLVSAHPHGDRREVLRARPQSPIRQAAGRVDDGRARAGGSGAGSGLSGRRDASGRDGGEGDDLESLRALVQKRERAGPSARKQSA